MSHERREALQTREAWMRRTLLKQGEPKCHIKLKQNSLLVMYAEIA
jgi:hypothetical protein